MFRLAALIFLLVVFGGHLGSCQSPTPAPANGTTIAPAPANGTTIAPAPANATTVAPSPANATTVAPPPANATTVSPSNSTTLSPSNTTTTLAPSNTTTTLAPTNVTTTAPAPQNTTTAAPPLPAPQAGNYSIQAPGASSACIMARMGLRIAYKPDGKDVQTQVNVDPKATNASGTCGGNGSDSSLLLESDQISIQFLFANESSRFRLHSLNVSVISASGERFSSANTTLSLWEASVGSSYMCRKEQSYDITSSLALHTFELQIQPFGVQNNKFSTAEECLQDSDLTFLVPIAVGVALSFLITLVLISYLIGRRKSRTGYQSV